MEYEKIKELMEDMSNSKLSSINIDFPDGTKIRMKKENQKSTQVTSNYKQIEDNNQKNSNLKEEKIKKENIVKSPMVGTFYIKPSPNSKPYVEIGSEVKKGNTLCIIEAMKLMNEIESEYTGKIAEIYVEDGNPVEYGEPLFRIE